MTIALAVRFHTFTISISTTANQYISAEKRPLEKGIKSFLRGCFFLSIVH